MNKMFTVTFLESRELLSGLPFPAHASGHTASPISHSQRLPLSLQTDLQEAVNAFIAQGGTPGTELYVSHPKLGSGDFVAGTGDLSTNSPLQKNSHFRAGSMLKSLVATAILQQVERGRLSLDDKLPQLLPTSITQYIANADAITVRELLQHRSGIGDWAADVNGAVISDPGHIWSLEEELKIAQQLGPTGPPGIAYSYSNTNYNLLGEILTRVSGRDWRKTIQRDVISAANMADSYLPQPGDRTMRTPFSRGYIDLGDGPLDFSGVDPSMAGASGGHALVTTPRDLTRFATALFSGKLFQKQATLTAMMSYLEASEPDAYQTGYGLGLSVTEVMGRKFYGHLGGTAGYLGYYFYEPASGFTFSGFLNNAGDLADVLTRVLEKLPIAVQVPCHSHPHEFHHHWESRSSVLHGCSLVAPTCHGNVSQYAVPEIPSRQSPTRSTYRRMPGFPLDHLTTHFSVSVDSPVSYSS